MNYKGYTIKEIDGEFFVYCGAILVDRNLTTIEQAKQSIDEIT